MSGHVGRAAKKKKTRSKPVRLTIGSVCTVSLIPRSFNVEFASGTVVTSAHGKERERAVVKEKEREREDRERERK